jgi:hypothetical protein
MLEQQKSEAIVALEETKSKQPFRLQERRGRSGHNFEEIGRLTMSTLSRVSFWEVYDRNGNGKAMPVLTSQTEI